jgi:shikimate dehydrogenase
VVLAMAEAGAAAVTVVGRRPDAARHCALLAGGAGHVGGVESAAAADVVVNATPVGMARPPARQLPPGLPFGLRKEDLGPGQLVVDLVYVPRRTPLLEVAEARGAAVADGIGMLVHQAALQVETWTGRPAPLDAMLAAVAPG